jgi:HlyD family secretion protein
VTMMMTKLRAPLLIPALVGFMMATTPALAEDTATVEPAVEPAVEPEPQAVLPAITVAVVEKSVLQDRVLASGLIGAVERVQVQPLIEGQPIETLEVDVGDMVEKGQVLARLSKLSLDLQQSQFTASLASARATIAQAEAQKVEAEAASAEAQRIAERARKLRAQGSATQAAEDTAGSNAVSATARVVVATQSLEAARAQLAFTEAQLANLELQRDRTEIRSPVAGEVVERNALLGSIATAAGAAMFVINRDAALEVRADLAEADLLKVSVGQKAELTFSGSTTPLTGTIRLVEPTIDLTTRQGRARITLDQPEALRAGMFVTAEIITAERDTISVPVTAISTTPEGARVMRVRDGAVEAVIVQTGIRQGDQVEILQGLVEGDRVVKKAGAFVRAGDKIAEVLDEPAVN